MCVVWWQVTTDWAGLIDAWALRFFSELAYETEAATADVFRAQMAKLPGIVVPAVYPALTTRMVLVTEWVQGALQLAGVCRTFWHALVVKTHCIYLTTIRYTN
jgi:predicted unusual protein kinase regulating ubiquinone biosynthesis (AarF/ABC1/UbiB family)